ncbi:MAG: MinD/ParA family protein [Lachnospiraceae bacterium]|nr:MinD/ParA family protein [Lachnospiraceae bacterium]
MDQAENLRKLVQQNNSQIARPVARVITVTSGKGGVGKSSLAVNLAIDFARLGKKVIIFDADFGLANIEIMLGIRPPYNLADLMFRGKNLEDIIVEGPEGIGFISGGSGIQELTMLSREQIIYLTQKLFQLDKLADLIIIDTGAGIADSVLEFVAASSEVLLVVTPEPTSITDAYALLKTLNRKSEFSIKNSKIRVVANRIAQPSEGPELFEKLSIVSEKFLDIPLEYLGSIPQDPNSSKSILQQQPISVLFPNSPSAKAITGLAEKICNIDTGTVAEKKGMAQLFSNLIKSRHRKKTQR